MKTELTRKFSGCLWTLLGVILAGGVDPAISVAGNGKAYASAAPVSAEGIVRFRPRAPHLKSSAALVLDKRDGVTLYGLNVEEQLPIASVTKLMTAMVTLDKHLPMGEVVTIAAEDRDHLRGSASRLPIGARLTRHDLLLTALAASDNRAAVALARTYPGGSAEMLRMMNVKARDLGMANTRFADPAGLNSDSISTAQDLADMVAAAGKYPLIKELSTTGEFSVKDQRRRGRDIDFVNTNRLVRSSAWDIKLSKTGYISESGNCLVMETVIGDRTVIIVLLNSWGKLTKYGDSQRIRDWLLRSSNSL